MNIKKTIEYQETKRIIISEEIQIDNEDIKKYLIEKTAVYIVNLFNSYFFENKEVVKK
jgi:hypothetical protein